MSRLLDSGIKTFQDIYEVRPLIHNLIAIIRQANIVVMTVYNSSDFQTEIKDDNSPLTLADTRSSTLICSELRSLDPSIPIICEETEMEPYEKRKKYQRFWLVDPLDGTKEFIKRNGEFTINIALLEKNHIGEYVPTVGVVSVPAQGLIYCGEQGYGSWFCNEITGETGRMECKPFNPEGPLTMVCSRSHMNKETEQFTTLFKVKDTIVSGSSIKFMKLCENKAQVYPRLHPCMEWDVAASDAILREAGGQIITTDESPFLYNKEDLLVDSFIAYGKSKK